jgi:hypothetical protein
MPYLIEKVFKYLQSININHTFWKTKYEYYTIKAYWWGL